MASPLPVALVQAPAHPAGDTASFLKDVEELAHQRPAVRLFVYPELHLCGAVKETEGDRRPPTPDQLAQPLDGQRNRDLASPQAMPRRDFGRSLCWSDGGLSSSNAVASWNVSPASTASS